MQTIPTISQSNISRFFNAKGVSSRNIQEGQIITFNYSSPDRSINDRAPLIYVLEIKQDRIFGLNLHYDMGVLNEAVKNKVKELDQYKKPSTKGNSILSKAPALKSVLPQGEEQETEIDEDVYETFNVNKDSTSILRNYLMSRMTGVRQLTWKK